MRVRALEVTPFGAVSVLVILGVPILGWILAILTDESLWLFLLAPLVVFMEGGVFLIVVAVIAASFFMGGS